MLAAVIRGRKLAWTLVAALALALSLAILRPWERPALHPTATADLFEQMRLAMVEEQLRARDISDEATLKAMSEVPRHLFVPEEYQAQAYADHPLPICYGQTISQPYIVALMTQSARLQPGDKVLEIGTGSGYQAAVLAALGAEVYSVEIIPQLAESAARRLRELGYSVKTDIRDGYYGWPEHAPYKAIIVTAAPDHVPPSLLEQLADGGRLIIPVGPPGSYQVLWLIEKHADKFTKQNLGLVRFVPLTGEH